MFVLYFYTPCKKNQALKNPYVVVDHFIILTLVP